LKALTVLRWIAIVFLVLLLLNAAAPFLQRFGFGKLPGDFRFKLFGRAWFLPISTTLLVSLFASTVARYI
jgi:ABC-type phosphate transport system permease subunit